MKSLILVSGIDIFHLRKQANITGLSGMQIFFHQDLLFIILNRMYVQVIISLVLAAAAADGDF